MKQVENEPRNAVTDHPHRELKLPDGRVLAYGLYGDADGSPVYFLHGFPSSRLLAGLVARKAAALRLCLVAPDRPGFGQSTACAGRSLLDFAFDLRALADHLDHGPLHLMGVSCGGPYALAAAYRLQDRVRSVALVAGMGPMDVPDIRIGQAGLLSAMFRLAKRHPCLIAPLLLADSWLYTKHPQRALRLMRKMLAPADREFLETYPELGMLFIRSMAEAYRQGIGPAMQEASLIGRARGFEMRTISVPVQIHQGFQDRHVPPPMARYLAQQLPHGRLFEYADEGHLSILFNQFEPIAGSLMHTR